MARFSGKIGYGSGETVENPPGSGIWVDDITEKTAFGDVEWSNRRYEHSDKVEGDISLNNSFSVVADAYANSNFMFIKYVEWNGVKWTVKSVEVKHPRLLIYVGEVYNGRTS